MKGGRGYWTLKCGSRTPDVDQNPRPGTVAARRSAPTFAIHRFVDSSLSLTLKHKYGHFQGCRATGVTQILRPGLPEHRTVNYPNHTVGLMF